MSQATTPLPPPRSPPPPPPRNGPAVARIITPGDFKKSAGKRRIGHRVGIYGPGGWGKSTLASLAPLPRFLDIERGTDDLAVQRVDPPDGIWTWEVLRAAVQCDSLWQTCQTVVLDTATLAEELARDYVLRTVPRNDQGERATSLESYGWKKGFTFLYDEYIKLLADLDAHVRAGRSVAMLLHDCVAKVPNPESEDFERFEPRLQAYKEANIRLRVREWCDHLLYGSYDIAVTKGKARGYGSRTIYCQELPWYMAKSRVLADPIPFQSASDDTLWRTLFPLPQGD